MAPQPVHLFSLNNKKKEYPQNSHHFPNVFFQVMFPVDVAFAVVAAWAP